MPNITKVVDRQKLKPRRDPYWSKMTKGCFLGFRKMTPTTSGAWLARCFDEATGKQAYKALGDFAELPDHQRHDAAKKAAQDWFTHLGRGGSPQTTTVRDTCAHYVAHLSETKSQRAARDAQARFNNYVLPHKRLAETELSKLTPAHFSEWRRALTAMPTTSGPNRGEMRSPSTLNRDMTCLRAALNLAFKDGFVTSNFAWHSKLLPIKNADQRRNLYLDADQRRAWIAQAPEDLANLLRGLCLLPLRPGALAALKVANFDKRTNTLTIGRDKSGEDRTIALPDSTAGFVATQCRDKFPTLPIFNRRDGSAWNKDAWKYPAKESAALAKLPAGATCYTVRHSVITDLVHAGLDLLTVAQLSGTSIKMIERHYGHLTQAQAKRALALLAV